MRRRSATGVGTPAGRLSDSGGAAPPEATAGCNGRQDAASRWGWHCWRTDAAVRRALPVRIPRSEITMDSSERTSPRVSPLLVALAASACLWVVLFAVIPAGRQDFPLTDDWAYARSTFAFARGEGVRYFGWASMPQLGQWLWALPFVWLLGESHVALRLSVILLSWLGAAALFDLLRQAGLSDRRAGFAAALLLLNPVFVLVSGTYLTDAPALAFSLIALACLVRGIRGERAGLMAAGALVACLGAVTRQNTLVAPLTAAVLLWGSPKLRTRPAWIAALLLPVALAVAADHWFAGRPDIHRVAPHLVAPLRIGIRALASTHLVGLWCVPALLLTRPERRSWRVFGVALALLLGGAAALYLSIGQLFPYVGNMVTAWGQFSLNDTAPGMRPMLIGPGLHWALTLAGCVAGAEVVTRVAGRLGRGWREPLVWFTGLQALLLLFPPYPYDRYILALLPGALWGVCGHPAAGPARRWAAFAALAAMGILSLALMHDWLSWNSARWTLGERALAHGIPAHMVEGGFEWNGWHSPSGAAPLQQRTARGLNTPITGMLFPHVTGRFALSFSPLPGTRVLDTEPYTVWLPPGRRQFYLLQLERRTPAQR